MLMTCECDVSVCWTLNANDKCIFRCQNNNNVNNRIQSESLEDIASKLRSVKALLSVP